MNVGYEEREGSKSSAPLMNSCCHATLAIQRRQHLAHVDRQVTPAPDGDIAGYTEHRLRHPTGNGGHGVAVTANRNRITNRVLVTRCSERADQRLRYGFLAGFVEAVIRPDDRE